MTRDRVVVSLSCSIINGWRRAGKTRRRSVVEAVTGICQLSDSWCMRTSDSIYTNDRAFFACRGTTWDVIAYVRHHLRHRPHYYGLHGHRNRLLLGKHSNRWLVDYTSMLALPSGGFRRTDWDREQNRRLDERWKRTREQDSENVFVFMLCGLRPFHRNACSGEAF